MVKQGSGRGVIAPKQTAVVDEGQRNQKIAENPATHMNERQYALPLPSVIDGSEVIARMPEAFGKHGLPSEAVIIGRTFRGIYETFPFGHLILYIQDPHGQPHTGGRE